MKPRGLHRPSLLDRLVTRGEGEAPVGEGFVLEEVRESVRRDLEDLLNTRSRATGWDESLSELETGLPGYGLPDFTGADLGSSVSRENFCRIIERTIRAFEPRLRNVTVRFPDDDEELERTLRFRIDAMLRTDPHPEAITFDSSYEPTHTVFDIRPTR